MSNSFQKKGVIVLAALFAVAVVLIATLDSAAVRLFIAKQFPAQAESKQAEEGWPVDLNTVSKERLMLLDGLGEKTADAILAYREQNGRFHSVDELEKVKGIGEKKLEKWGPYFFVE